MPCFAIAVRRGASSLVITHSHACSTSAGMRVGSTCACFAMRGGLRRANRRWGSRRGLRETTSAKPQARNHKRETKREPARNQREPAQNCAKPARNHERKTSAKQRETVRNQRETSAKPAQNQRKTAQNQREFSAQPARNQRATSVKPARNQRVATSRCFVHFLRLSRGRVKFRCRRHIVSLSHRFVVASFRCRRRIVSWSTLHRLLSRRYVLRLRSPLVLPLHTPFFGRDQSRRMATKITQSHCAGTFQFMRGLTNVCSR